MYMYIHTLAACKTPAVNNLSFAYHHSLMYCYCARTACSIMFYFMHSYANCINFLSFKFIQPKMHFH